MVYSLLRRLCVGRRLRVLKAVPLDPFCGLFPLSALPGAVEHGVLLFPKIQRSKMGLMPGTERAINVAPISDTSTASMGL
jgi:hypothetical protein